MANFFLRTSNVGSSVITNRQKKLASGISPATSVVITCGSTTITGNSSTDLILDSLEVVESGDYMTGRKCTVSFTCLTDAAFKAAEKDFGFIDKNKSLKITIKHEWPDGTTESSDTWDFRIIEPKFTINNDGTYSFATRGIGAGSTIESANAADAAMSKTGAIFTTDYNWSNDQKTVETLTDFIHYTVQLGTNTLTSIDFDPPHGACGQISDGWWLVLKTNEDVYEAPEQSVVDTSLIYVSLSAVVGIINQYFSPTTSPSILKIRLNATGTTAYKTAGGDTFNIFSADPIRIFLPYGSAEDSSYHVSIDDELNVFDFITNMGEAAPALQACDISGGKLDGIFINVDVLETILHQTPSKTSNNTFDTKNPAKVTVESFFKQIFATIKELTGGAFDLVIRLDPDKNTPGTTEFVIVNERDQADSTVKPVAFAKGDGTVLSMTINSKITKELIAAAYGGAPGSDGDQSGTAAVGRQKADTPGDNKEGLPEWQELFDVRWRVVAAGIKEDDTNAAKGVLRRLISQQTTGEKAKQTSGVYPLELSLSILGTDGFRFGDAITVDELPDRYRNSIDGAKVVFTVHEVAHKFTAGDRWVTDLKTILRMAPSSIVGDAKGNPMEGISYDAIDSRITSEIELKNYLSTLD